MKKLLSIAALASTVGLAFAGAAATTPPYVRRPDDCAAAELPSRSSVPADRTDLRTGRPAVDCLQGKRNVLGGALPV